MAKWQITNVKSGADLGIYEAETAEEAIRKMLEEAGSEEEPSDSLVAERVD